MQGITCVRLGPDLLLVLVELASNLVPLVVLVRQGLVQCRLLLCFSFKQHLFVLLELLNVAIEHLDFLVSDFLDFLQVVRELPVAHLEVALVADSVLLWVVLGELTLCLAANLANGLATLLAVAHWIAVHELVLFGERGFTKLTLVNFFANDSFPVEILGQAFKLFLHVDVANNASAFGSRAWLRVFPLSS